MTSKAQSGERANLNRYRLTGTNIRKLGFLVVGGHTAQQAQPSAPQKLLRSEIGNLVDQAVA